MDKIAQNNIIYLRTLTLDDAIDFWRLNQDPLVLQYTGDVPFKNIEEARMFLVNYKNYSRDGYGRWAVCLQTDDSFIGWCGLNKSIETGLVDIGFRFYQNHWNKGHASSASALCVDYGFNTLGLHQIVANAYLENKASIRVLEKCGLRFLKNSNYDQRESVFYSILNIQVKELYAKDTYSLRKAVLRKNIPSPCEFEGDNDQDTFHLGTYFKDELLGVCSFMKSNTIFFGKHQYQLRGMATSSSWQGKGLGTYMLKEAERRLTLNKQSIIWCNAREIALGFYKKQGFKIYGNPFEIEYIGTHYIMYKQIK